MSKTKFTTFTSKNLQQISSCEDLVRCFSLNCKNRVCFSHTGWLENRYVSYCPYAEPHTGIWCWNRPDKEILSGLIDINIGENFNAFEQGAPVKFTLECGDLSSNITESECLDSSCFYWDFEQNYWKSDGCSSVGGIVYQNGHRLVTCECKCLNY